MLAVQTRVRRFARALDTLQTEFPYAARELQNAQGQFSAAALRAAASRMGISPTGDTGETLELFIAELRATRRWSSVVRKRVRGPWDVTE